MIPSIERDFSKFVSFSFEDICRRSLYSDNFLGLEKIGREWGKTREGAYEIDICGINEQTKTILFGECKWMDNVGSFKILDELKSKSRCVSWNQDNRREYYAIFARSFSNKVNQKNVRLYDLEDIFRIFKNR